MNRKKPTKEQINSLMTDWLQDSREKETFIHKDTQGAIDRKMSKGQSLSEYIVGGGSMDAGDLMHKARDLAQSTVNTMTSKRIRVTVGGSQSATDGSTINVSSQYFDDTRLTAPQKADILIGMAIHETCHINHSDFDILQKIGNQLPPLTAEIKRHIVNIIEDERIEHLLGTAIKDGGDGMPGYTDYIACVKDYVFGSYARQIEKAANAKEKIPLFLNSLLKAVRFPSALTRKEVTEQYEHLEASRQALTPFPKTTKDVEDAADRILEIMKDMLEDRRHSGRQQKEQSKDGSGDSAQPSGDGSANGANGAKQQGQQNRQGSSRQNDDGKSDAGGQKNEDARSDALEKALATTAAKEIGDIIKSISQATNDKDKNAQCLCNRNEKEYINGENEKVGGGAGAGDIKYITKAKGNIHAYNASLAKVKRWIPSMARALRCRTQERDYELMGMKNGRLNTNRLASLKCGNVNIFSQRGEVTADAACVCMLVDESGSMEYGGRLNGARDAAILIKESLKKIPSLRFFAYGFTTGRLMIYHENNAVSPYALGNTVSADGTPTAQAMRIAAKRVRKFTQDKCLMVIITDGCPDNRNETIDADRELPKKGFIPVGVDIAGGQYVKDIFENYVSVDDMSQLPQQLGKIVKKKLNGIILRHDSMN